MENNNQNEKSFDKVLKDLKPAEIAEHETVRDKFVDSLVKIHRMPEHEATSVYEREKNYYQKAINEGEESGSGKLHTCTNFSLFNAFMEIAILGLSIQPGGKAEAFIEPRWSTKREIDKDGKPVDKWILTARLVVMTHGELNLRLRSGQIVRMANPQVIYEGDVFQPRTNEKGDLTVDYRPLIPRKQGAKIIGCYVSLVLPHDQRDFKWLLQEDIERLKNFSTPKATKTNPHPKPNALYVSGEGGQIDVGFLETKTIKHAMRTLTKLKVNATFEDDDPEHEPNGNGFEPNNPTDIQPANTTVVDNNDDDPDKPF